MKANVTSRDNPYIKEYLKLKKSRPYRNKSCQIAVEGPNLVKEALKAGLSPRALFVTDDYYKTELKDLLGSAPFPANLIVITEKLFKEIAETDTPQTVAAVFPFNFIKAENHPGGYYETVLILDHLQDPGNVGTIIRTAAAAGFERIYYTKGCADPYSPKALRATAGAIFRMMPLLEEDPLKLAAQLQNKGFQVIASTAGSGIDYRAVDYDKPTVLVIGNEAGGISPEMLNAADLLVTIPLPGEVESLNAAVAAGILIFEIIRCRA